MANTVITNYTDLNGPSTKTDSSVVVIVNKDGSLSVDQNLLGTLMGSDGSQAAGISVVRVGHEGKPDDATDSENEDDKIPHVTLSVDSYYDEPNSIIKYDSGAEMLQSLRIETRENSLVGFHNDHCYTPLTSPSQVAPQRNEAFASFDDPIIEITQTPPPKPVQGAKKITILEQQIIPKGKKIIINPSEASVIMKGNDILNKPLPVINKLKHVNESEKKKVEDSSDSSSVSSSSESAPDRDSDSDYKDTKDRSLSQKLKRNKLKPRILKSSQPVRDKNVEIKSVLQKPKSNRSIVRRDIKEKIHQKNIALEKKDTDLGILTNKDNISLDLPINTTGVASDQTKIVSKQVPKILKKEKKTPAHVTALLSDMTSLFSTPDVIRRVSTDNKTLPKPEKEPMTVNKKLNVAKPIETIDSKINDPGKIIDPPERIKTPIVSKTYSKYINKLVAPSEKVVKTFDTIPQLDDASLAQILQDTTTPTPMKIQPSIPSHVNVLNSPGLAGPLSPTLDLLAGLQPEEEGLTEDLLMHVAQLVESSENLQEVIDKQVLGKVDAVPPKTQPIIPVIPQQPADPNLSLQTPSKTLKTVAPRKDPIEIVRRDGRVITLPPIEAPATRASKRKSQVNQAEPILPTSNITTPTAVQPAPRISTPEPVVQQVSRQYVNRKLTAKKQEQAPSVPVIEKHIAESQESMNSEDDPYRLWCICKQPHNNRFMISCDGCDDWFHGKCVNITKAMGQQMEEQGIEWRCPNCVKSKSVNKNNNKLAPASKNIKNQETKIAPSPILPKDMGSKTNCIVCRKSARASSIYCSDACILKHAQDSLGNQESSKGDEPGKIQDKTKTESKVIVYERKTGRLLAGPNAPTAENLKSWLQKNPTFEVVRPGTLSTIKPNQSRKKPSGESNKIQTTLNFERIPRKPTEQTTPKPNTQEQKEKVAKPLPSPKEEVKTVPQPKTPVTPKPQIQQKIVDTPKSQSSVSIMRSGEPRKLVRTMSRSQPSLEKTPSVSPSTPRRKDASENRMRKNSAEPIRDNVRKALQEQMTIRMAETSGPRFTEDEIQQFAKDTELELHELFRDVGMKYKAKYRSLMFNIKDRKNLSLWQKICDHTITPQQLVRLSPEELASQELAQWRDKEAKHQLELIKKSELDLLAASKTYVLKTHKGEEVMETKESVSTELDPNVPVEDLVTALNDSMGNEQPTDNAKDTSKKADSVTKQSNKKYGSSKKKDKENGLSSHSKNKREAKRDSESRKSRSSRRRSERKDREQRSTRRSERKSSSRSQSKERSKTESKEKTESKHRSRSRVKSRRRSKQNSRSASCGRERSRSTGRSRRRSRSKEVSKRRHRSPSKHSPSREEKVEKVKQRSRSQETTYSKSKNDSTDSDSIERPKSAMLKDVHPEYDPHEPMITSAFSEEDLRKSREDVYEDSYKNDLNDYSEVDYDPSKTFSISSSVLPTESYLGRQDKASEVESDQEPSSTVENSAPIVWNGCINMVDVARFYVAAHEVSGNAIDLEDDLAAELNVVGRINPETVWDYIVKMKRAGNKDIVLLRLQAANDEEKMQYIALYSYLSSRHRLGVVKVSDTATVKDFYIVPLSANSSLPEVLLPLDGPGLEVKTHLLIAIVIRQRKKRLPTNIPKEIIPTKVVRESRKRSYSPPVGGKASYTPPASPKRRMALPLPAYSTPALSTSVKDKIAATLASADDDEAYSPGSSTSSNSAPASSTLRCKMEELNRQIEEQKLQILKMAQADSSIGAEDEAYSPSRPMTPPSVVPLADIALPSNLHEILATIKQRTETTADIDMRTLQPPL